MLWFVFSLLTAISESTKDMFGKRGLRKFNEYVAAWSWVLFSLPFLIPVLFFTGIPVVDEIFWYAVIIGGLLNAIAYVLYMRAIKVSPLSVTIPMITFTPLFLLLTSPLILGEFPTVFGLFGILLIVFGSYLLNIGQVRKGLLYPFRALVKERGPVLMLLVSFIWSITSNIDKIGVLHSSPVFYIITIYTFIACILFPAVLLKSGRNFVRTRNKVRNMLPIGLFSALAGIFQMIAITLAIVPYVISIKRTSAIFSVIYGYFVFKEIHVRERLLGAVVMILGILLITVF